MMSRRFLLPVSYPNLHCGLGRNTEVAQFAARYVEMASFLSSFPAGTQSLAIPKALRTRDMRIPAWERNCKLEIKDRSLHAISEGLKAMSQGCFHLDVHQSLWDHSCRIQESFLCTNAAKKEKLPKNEKIKVGKRLDVSAYTIMAAVDHRGPDLMCHDAWVLRQALEILAWEMAHEFSCSPVTPRFVPDRCKPQPLVPNLAAAASLFNPLCMKIESFGGYGGYATSSSTIETYLAHPLPVFFQETSLAARQLNGKKAFASFYNKLSSFNFAHTVCDWEALKQNEKAHVEFIRVNSQETETEIVRWLDLEKHEKCQEFEQHEEVPHFYMAQPPKNTGLNFHSPKGH